MADELRLLPRGRGLLADDIDQRVGPLLRESLGLADKAEPGVVRRALTDRLQALSEQLPTDLARAIRAALALDPAMSNRFLKDRVGHYAKEINRDPRTAKRRVSEGLRRLAELIVHDHGPDDGER